MSRVKLAAQLIQDQDFEIAGQMLEKEKEQEQALYWLSLIYQMKNRYVEEAKIITDAVQKFPNNPYFQERLSFHKKPMFEKMIPRDTLHLPRDRYTLPINQTLEQSAIVTGGDAGYFELMVECIESIRATRYYKDLPVFILDFGLTEEQRQYFYKNLGVKGIKDPGLDVPIEHFYRYSPSRKQVFTQTFDMPGVLALSKRTLACAYLDEHFPGYRYYLWIDGDAWVQDDRALDRYFVLTQKQGIAGTIHDNFSLANSGFLDPNNFDEDKKHIFRNRGTFTSGVTCIDTQSAFFHDWKKFHTETIKKYGCWYAMEELTMNYAFYKHNGTQVLQYENNYRFNPGIPVVFKNDPTLRNPQNNQIIGIVHLPSFQKERYYYETQEVSALMSPEQMQQHAQVTHQTMANPNYKTNLSKPQVSLRYRVWPWQDIPDLKERLMTEVRECQG